MNGLLLKEKASNFAKELGVPNFQTSEGWLENVSNVSFNILIYFSSAVNCNKQGTFIPFQSPRFTGFPVTTTAQTLFSLVFK